MQLRPSEQQTILWQVSDPNDNNTYFPQVVIQRMLVTQNGASMSTLATLNLVSQGNGQYLVNYQVPQDSSNLGFHISETLTIYTDSGHTTKSPNYNIENRIYLVQERFNASFGGTGSSVDYEKIAKMINAALAGHKIEFPEFPKFQAPEKVDLNKPLSALKAELIEEFKPMISGSSKDFISALEKHKKEVLSVMQERIDGLDISDKMLEVKNDMELLVDQRISEIESQLAKVLGAQDGDVRSLLFNFHKNIEELIASYFQGIDTITYNKADKIGEIKKAREQDYQKIAERLL